MQSSESIKFRVTKVLRSSYSDKSKTVNLFEIVAIKATLAFSSFYFEQNAEKLIDINRKFLKFFEEIS